MRKRNGFTLLELVIVLALIALVSVIVASFSMMMSRQAAYNKQKMLLISEVDTAKTMLQNWVESHGGTAVTCTNGDTKLQHGDEIYVDGGKMRIKAEGETSFSTILSFDTIQKITFSFEGDETKKLFFCTIYTTGEDTPYLTFTIYPHVGQTIGGGA